MKYSSLFAALLLASGISSFFFSEPALGDDQAWVRIHHSSSDQRLQGVAREGLSDYGSYQWGQVPVAALAELESRGVRVTQLDSPFELQLGEYRFDPLVDVPQSAGRSAQSGADFRLVQFQGPIRSAWLDTVRDQGIELVHYIHPYSYVVWADQSQLNSAASLSGVRWAGEFLTEFRVQPDQRQRDGEVVHTMALVSRHADQAGVQASLEAAGAAVHRFTPVTAHTSVVHLEVAGDRYWELGQIPEVYTVQYIPPETGPRTEMSNQSIVGNYGPAPGHTLFPGYADWLSDTGYDGDGVVVSIVDNAGIRESHQDLVGQMLPCVPSGDTPTSCSSGTSNHATHVAGAIAGSAASGTVDSAGFLRGQGVAPGAKMVGQRYNPFTTGGGMIPDGMLMIFRETALSGATHSNNSWGPAGSPQGYDIPSQQLDMIVRDALPEVAGSQPILPVWSIMNGNGDSGGFCSPSSLGSPDEAKNLFGVGSTRMQPSAGNQYPNIFDVSGNSAHGPTCDGRTGLHIVAPGCSTDSTGSSSDSNYNLGCGTSMASPVVSGAVAIFTEKYRDMHGGQTPSPAMMKAAVTAPVTNLHGFRNADGGTITETPSRFQGYGRLDLDAVANPPFNVMYFDQDEVFTSSGQEWSLSLMADDPAEPVRLMLMWTDAPGHGTGGDTPAWVNDLDLVVDAGSDQYLGNVIGSDGFSETGGLADARNNAEAVFLRSDQHGGNAFEVTVAAINIAADALDPHTPGAPAQDFALVCYNCDFGDPTFTLAVTPEAAMMCAPEDGTDTLEVEVTVGVIADYTGTVTLDSSGEPTGVSSSFDPVSGAVPFTASWIFTSDSSSSPGTTVISLSGTDGVDSKDVEFALTLEVPPAATELLGPIGGIQDVAVRPQFAWESLDGIDDYRIQVATDADFNTVVIDETVSDTEFVPALDLAIGTDHFWRVLGVHQCGEGDWSLVESFRTRFDPVAEIDPAQLSFVIPTSLGDSAEVSITNIGSGTLEWSLSTSSCGGPNLAWIDADPTSGQVEAGQSGQIDVLINTHGLGIGEYSGALCITTNQASGSPIEVPVDLEVTELIPGALSLSPAALEFDEVNSGQSAVLELTVSNTAPEGAAEITLGEISVIVGAPAFSLTGNECGAQLPAQHECTVEVSFSPEAPGNLIGVLRIIADGQSHFVNLTGEGTEPEPIIFHDRFEE